MRSINIFILGDSSVQMVHKCSSLLSTSNKRRIPSISSVKRRTRELDQAENISKLRQRTDCEYAGAVTLNPLICRSFDAVTCRRGKVLLLSRFCEPAISCGKMRDFAICGENVGFCRFFERSRSAFNYSQCPSKYSTRSGGIECF